MFDGSQVFSSITASSAPVTVDLWMIESHFCLLGSRSPSPISSLSLPISFLVGQRKTRKLNERKKEEKGKKVPIAKKKEEWCVFVQRGMVCVCSKRNGVFVFLRKNMFWRIEITSWHWRLLRLEAGAAQDYRG